MFPTAIEMMNKYKNHPIHISKGSGLSIPRSLTEPSMYTPDQLNMLAIEMECSPKDFYPENASTK